MILRIGLVGVLLPVLFPGSLALAQPNDQPAKPLPAETDEKAVRASIERALPFIEKHGVEWMEQKKCATCHHSTFMVWSLNAAADRGFPVDAAKLAEWNEWARDFRSIRGRDRKDANEYLAHKTFQGSPDEVSQLLLGQRVPHKLKPKSDQEQRWSFAMATLLLDGQQQDGSWKPGGQLPSQKRPLRETAEVTTMWTLVAITATRSRDDSVRAAEERAAGWLKDATVGVSTEWWAVRMLWERGRERAEKANFCREKLLQSQRKDGGWGWLLTDESDALGTGIALYALQRDGVSRDHESIRRAIDFLRKSQREDGSWSVKGTKKDRRDRAEPTAAYWGTCWAVIGLLESLSTPERK